MILTQKGIERFWSKVGIRDSDDCRKWKGGLSSNGYGVFRVGERGLSAHRIAWELTNGSIPDGKLILHKCDNKKCCNTDHLYVGTNADNMGDRAARNPNNQGGGQIKLSKEEIQRVRDFKGKYSSTWAAYLLSVSSSTILRIWRREGCYA